MPSLNLTALSRRLVALFHKPEGSLPLAKRFAMSVPATVIYFTILRIMFLPKKKLKSEFAYCKIAKYLLSLQ